MACPRWTVDGIGVTVRGEHTSETDPPAPEAEALAPFQPKGQGSTGVPLPAGQSSPQGNWEDGSAIRAKSPQLKTAWRRQGGRKGGRREVRGREHYSGEQRSTTLRQPLGQTGQAGSSCSSRSDPSRILRLPLQCFNFFICQMGVIIVSPQPREWL